jgi:Tol biopolymer transport system component
MWNLVLRNWPALVLLGLASCGTISPTLMFVESNNVWKMYEDGTGKVMLVSGADRAQWIPGTKTNIAYLRHQGPTAAIFVADDSGKNEKQLTQYNVGDDFSWSLDGQWIAFETDRHGKWQIYKVNRTTGQEVRLTSTTSNDRRPRWNAFGTQIAFESDRRGGDWDVWVMNMDGGSQTNVTGGVGDGYDGRAVWATDDKRLAHVCNHVGWGGPRICVASLTAPVGTGPFSQHESQVEPLWSPSNDYIFYLSYENGKYTLHKQEVAAGKAAQAVSTGWSTPSAGVGQRYMDTNEVALFFSKGPDLYSAAWRSGGESKLGAGHSPDTW